MNKDVTLFGEVNFRSETRKFGIKTDDRRRHMYVIGKSGVGKTTLLENMVISDIRAGHGVGVVDPHGEFAEKLLHFIPKERVDDVIYFNPADNTYPIAFNPLSSVPKDMRPNVASGMMGVFKKIWVDAWSARMEYILNNALLALLEYPDATLLGIMRLLNDKAYRTKIVENLEDPVIKNFWVNEFSRYAQRFETEATAAIQNKVGQFITNPLIRNIIGQTKSAIDMRKVMDERKILIVNLSKGRIGEDNSALLGSMIITRLQLSAMSRSGIPESQLKDFFLYVDEFQNFATDSFANILSEARKYRLSLVLAHQYINQLVHDTNTKVRDAVFGNVGTLISFRVGAADAEFLEKEFEPEFMANDLVNLPKHSIYAKLLIDGIASKAFSARTLPPNPLPKESFKDEIIENSRKKYGTPREKVENVIAGEWLNSPDDIMEGRMQGRELTSPRGFDTSSRSSASRPPQMRSALTGTPRESEVKPASQPPRQGVQREPIAPKPPSPAQPPREELRREPIQPKPQINPAPKESKDATMRRTPNIVDLRTKLQEALKKRDEEKKEGGEEKAS